jgi:hypothetical protein
MLLEGAAEAFLAAQDVRYLLVGADGAITSSRFDTPGEVSLR